MEPEFLLQLVNSISDAAEKLEQAKRENNVKEFNKIKSLILNLRTKIGRELEND